MGTREVERVVHIQMFFLKAMVTDSELFLMNDNEVVFPSSGHLLYFFHVEKNIGANCKEFIEVNRQDHMIEQ